MSTYAYHCQECCSESDRRFAIGKAPDYVACRVCKRPARLIINAPAIHFGKDASRSSYGAKTAKS